jgi:leader peptidase (prepilin peptidase) / N-methyltransferase
MSAETMSAIAPEKRSDRSLIVTTTLSVVAAALCFILIGLSAKGLLSAFFAVVLVVLGVIDFETRIIPNRIVVPAGAIVLLAHIAIRPSRTLEWTIAAVAAFAAFLVLALINPAGLGMGDVKLAFLIGAGLGWAVIPALVLGTFAAAFYGLFVIVTRGRGAAKTAFPLGPFLAGAAIVVLLLQ